MNKYTKEDIEKALCALESMIAKSKNAQLKFAQGTSQYTLQKNRINALKIALALVSNECCNENVENKYSKEELEEALVPIASLISKSEKAQKKLGQDTWQYKMLEDNLKALYIATLLFERFEGN